MIRFLADRTDDGRLVRGHEILDNNQLEEIVVDERHATAKVVGTAHYPYVIDMRYAALDRFDERGTRFDCSCPDWGDPCKHGVALALTLAARLDLDHAQDETLAEVRRSVDPVTTRVEPPSDRPKWAENVVEQPTPATFDDWLGHADRSRPVAKLADADPFDTVLALGRLAITGGPDLAPEIGLLASRLRDG